MSRRNQLVLNSDQIYIIGWAQRNWEQPTIDKKTTHTYIYIYIYMCVRMYVDAYIYVHMHAHTMLEYNVLCHMQSNPTLN